MGTLKKIKIAGKGKQYIQLNTATGKKPTNKVKILIQKDRIARYYPDEGICLLKPIIDRIVLTYDLEDYSPSDKADIQGLFIKALQVDAIHTDDYQSVDFFHKQKPKYNAYAVNVRMKHKPTGHGILIQAVPSKEDKPFLRFDFSPAILGAEGVKFFKNKLSEDFSIPGAVFDFDHIAKRENTIKRLDIAVDILGADVCDMSIMSAKGGKPNPEISMQYANESKRTETIYPKTKPGKSSKTYIYNKKAKSVKDTGKSMYPKNILHTRFEHRVETTKHSLYGLTGLMNHLKKVQCHIIDYSTFADKDFTHILFMEYAKNRGLDKTLEIIPKEHHEDFIDTYNKAIFNIWHPEEMWEHWPDVLKSSGLLEE